MFSIFREARYLKTILPDGLIIQCESFLRYIRYILAEIEFWLSQCECFNVNKFMVFFLIEQNLIGLAKEMSH